MMPTLPVCLSGSLGFRRGELVLLCAPANPYGRLTARHPAGIDHSNEPEWMQKARQAPLRTLGEGGVHGAVNGWATSPRSSE